MNDSEKLLNELKDIRTIMERSNRFLSLSGLSGILIGIYALIGAFLAYKIVYISFPSTYRFHYVDDVIYQLAIIGLSVLIASIITVVLLTTQRAKKENKSLMGPGSKLLLINLLIPLVSGGILIVILIFRGMFGVVSPLFLIFYGLALVNAAKYTRPEIFTFGIIEIVLGLIAAALPGYGLILWYWIWGAAYYLRISLSSVSKQNY